MSRSVGIVIPVYRPDIDRLGAYLNEIRERIDPAVIRIEADVPGGANEAIRELPATVNAVDARRGKGAAVTDGFEELDTDVLAFADADGSTPADSLAEVIAPVEHEKVGLAVGSRRHPDAEVRSHQTYARRWLGNGFAWFARALLDVPLYDFQCGAKAIDHEVWEAVRHHLYEPGFAWDLELIAMADAMGYGIREVPIEWEDQPGSTVSPIRDTYRLARALFVVRHRARSVRDHPIHATIDTYREGREALVDRGGVKND